MIEKAKIHLLHRMPAGLGIPLGEAIDQCVEALSAGYDGCLIPAGVDPSETQALDGFALAGLIARHTQGGRIGLTDVSLSVLSPDEILRRAMVLTSLAPNRIDLGLSLGRPRDLWAGNVAAGRARRDFPLRLAAVLAAFGRTAADPAVRLEPAFRSIPRWPTDLVAPEVFISGTYCAENRAAIDRHALPCLTYDDPLDETLSIPPTDLLLRVDLTGTTPTASADSRLFGTRVAPPGYYDADEYRTRLSTQGGAPLYRGTVSDVARDICHVAGSRRRIVVDCWIEGMDHAAYKKNHTLALAELLPALRAAIDAGQPK